MVKMQPGRKRSSFLVEYINNQNHVPEPESELIVVEEPVKKEVNTAELRKFMLRL
jgi:hypothetical protein